MIQYFKYSDVTASVKYPILSGKPAVKFFTKYFLVIPFLVYSTMFLAAAIPFLEPHSPIIYIIGIILTIVFTIRFISFIYQYSIWKTGSISLDNNGITTENLKNSRIIKKEDIFFIEYTLLGNIKIKTKDDITVFPVWLLNETERKNILRLFTDVSPARTAVLKKIWELIDAVLMALVLAVHIIQFFIQNYYIPTCSMEDTLMVDDHLFAEKITYGPRIPKMLGMKNEVHLKFLGLRDIQRGDIIIFRPPYPGDETKDYIKRCIAIEGDDFHIENNTVYINGEKLDEPYIKGITNYRGFPEILLEGKVPEGMVIAMGDNRENSQDGRYFGYLPKERIKAKAFVMYLNKSDLFNFNFKRFGLIR